MFDRVAAKVRKTPPLGMAGNSPIFLSMVCKRDVNAYLLAIKSLYSAVGGGRIVMISDGSLDTEDLRTLQFHLPICEVIDINSIDTGRCPRGGTWERLTKIIDLTADDYVIQMDADTLVSGSIHEVVEAYNSNKSFLLGTDIGQSVAPAAQVASLMKELIEKHGWTNLSVGVLAESALDTLPNVDRRRYVHASSGFAGFARGAFRFADLEEFSSLMRERLGPHWDEWGSEQIASNYMLANAPDAIVLPFSRYACFEPHLPPGERPFLHFIGSYRFNDGVYRKQAQTFLSQYSSASA